MSDNCNCEKFDRIAVLGPENSYSHFLGEKVFDSDKNEFILFDNIEAVFKEVSKNENVIGIVPFENMIHGSVRETFICLKKYDIKIVKSFDLSIHHCLASKSKNFKKIASHPQALAQCSDFLEEFRNRGIEIVESSSTSKAMELASLNKDYAAIGNEVAASKNELSVLNKNIENNSNNVTRFVEISKKCCEFSSNKNAKSSLMLVPKEDRPGLLFEILALFKIKDINLTKIESIPTGKGIGEYLFYIDIEGSVLDDNIKVTIEFLKTIVDVNLFGSYEVIKVE